jgi:hypothetical protein
MIKLSIEFIHNLIMRLDRIMNKHYRAVIVVRRRLRNPDVVFPNDVIFKTNHVLRCPEWFHRFQGWRCSGFHVRMTEMVKYEFDIFETLGDRDSPDIVGHGDQVHAKVCIIFIAGVAGVAERRLADALTLAI